MEELPVELAKYGSGQNGYRYFFDFDVRDPVFEKRRLKIEINTREHFTILDPEYHSYGISTDWYEGETEIRTYQLTEMIAHKLIALYDRKKGRDLFDLWYVTREEPVSPEAVRSCYNQYVQETREAGRISRAEYERNLSRKMNDPTFREDVDPLIASGIDYDVDEAVFVVHEHYIQPMKGDVYQGADNLFKT